MNEYLISGEKIVSGKANANAAAQKKTAEEQLRKAVRRAVKIAPVPADLEWKVLNLLKRQSAA